MKITIVSYIYPYPERGFNPGIERVVQELARELVRQNHEVHVITTYRNGGTLEKESDEGVIIHRIPDTRLYFGSIGSVFSIDHLSINLALRSHEERLEDSDVVHTFTPIIGKSFSTPLVAHYHHWDEPSTFKEYLYIPTSHRLWLRCYRTADKVIAVSEYSRDELAAKGIEKHKIKVVPNGVDLERFYPGRSRIEFPDWNHVLLYVGPLMERKGLSYLIEAMEDIVRQHPDTGLVIVGGGSDDHLRELVDDYDLAPHVRFEGFVDDQDLPEYYKAADVFVLPSLLEGFGMVLVEAMACGLPIVSTDTTAIPEVVGESGILVSPRDSFALAEGVSELIQSDDQIQSDPRTRVEENFTWKGAAERLQNIYSSLIN